MSNEIRTKITEILSHAGVRFSAIYMGEKKNALGGTGTMDRWECTFERGEDRPEMIEFDFFTGLGLRKKYPYFHNLEWQKPDKPQAPHPADLLYSLTRDAEACDMSFGTWCNEFGCDTDSRKALETYEACQRDGDKLRGFFTREQIEAFANVLQDY